jgi:hypothetical protein
MSKLTTQPTVITTAAVNPFTRRTFMKTSALTVGAVTLLSKGTALAEEGVGSSSGAVQTFEWGLVCAKDPGGDHDPKMDTDFGHNGRATNRTWWARSKSTWDGGDDAVALEIKATGPVGEKLDTSTGALIITNVMESFSVTEATIKAYVNNDADDGDNLWAGRFYSPDPATDDNKRDDEMAFAEAPLPVGRLSIGKGTGTVSFEDNPVVLTPIENGCKSSKTSWQGFCDQSNAYDTFFGAWQDYKLVGAGAVGPQIQVSGAAGFVPVNDTAHEFSLGATVGGKDGPNAAVGYKVTTKALPQTTTATLPWSFHRVRRTVLAGGKFGQWDDMGVATAENMPLNTAAPK